MLKRLLIASALFSTVAMAQEVNISGKDFLSGAGDARLSDIARQAAASGKKLVVTAPQYWQGKVAAKLHAGAANASVQMSEGFFENVLVRVEDNKAEPAKADAATAEASKADAAKADAAKADAAKAAAAKAEARAAAEKTAAEHAAADQAAAVQAAAQKAATERAAAEKAAADAATAKVASEKIAVQKAAAEKAAAEKTAADKLVAARQNMEKNLNDGRPAAGSLAVTQLLKDDQVFIDGSIRGVVRRVGAHPQMYWLEGELNFDRIELLPSGAGRYNVVADIHETANPTLRTHTSAHFVGNVPPPESAERKSLQQQYAEGHEILGSLHPTDLRSGDIVYTGEGAAVVARRTGLDLLRYWLDGDLNLGQTGINKQGGNAYRVLTDTVK